MRAYSDSNRWVRGEVIRPCSAVEQAAEPNSGFLMPFTGTEPVVVTWYCTALWPERYTALPATLMQVNVLLPLPAANRSPMRPPQPEVAPSGESDCQNDCWSLCENSLGGSGTERAVYWALVVGCTSVPTLSSVAILPASKIGSSGASPGASAYWRSLGRAVVGLSTVGPSVARSMAMLLRNAA